MTQATNELARTLLSFGHVGLFMGLDATALDRMWSEPGAPERLRELILDDAADPEARFLAAEVLFARASGFPPGDLKPALASIYTRAMGSTEVANPWGLPGEIDGAGQHLLQLGDAVVAPLMHMLQDERPRVYAGSKDATVGNSFGYRVKDLAAFYLSRLLNLPYLVHQRPSERDLEIDALRAALTRRSRGSAR
ncbi:MAG TPA: hypothetical protein VEL75_14420 [Candidatus Methylomirabilis sp.]|nr:hypothetical protein [Candidatus Methylomirabilis sp.]